MHEGWIKLWRKSIDKGWLAEPKLWAFWCWCLLKASHQKHDVLVGHQQVTLKPGQFIFGLHAASKELKQSIRSIRTHLKFMESIERNMTRKATNKFSIITLCNWELYNNGAQKNDKLTDKRVTSNRQASDNKQECKNDENENKIQAEPGCDVHVQASDSDVQEFIAWWKREYKARYRVDYVLLAKEDRIVSKLLTVHGMAFLDDLAGDFFNDTTEYICDNEHTIRRFGGMINRLAEARMGRIRYGDDATSTKEAAQ